MLQNLLSKRAKRKIVQEYYLRLATVGMCMVALSFVVGLIALLPVYMSVGGERAALEAEKQVKKQDAEDNKELLEEVQQGERMVTFLEDVAKKEKCTGYLREALKERPEGITISGFSYNKQNKQITLEGIAATRDVVVPYARALEANTFFSTVPVPISDLAKNTNLEFHLIVGIADTVTNEL